MRKASKRTYVYCAALLLSALSLILLRNPDAFGLRTLEIWLRQSSILGVLAIGLTFINLCGNFDISTGSIMSLSGAACVYLFALRALPLPIVLLLVLALAAGCCLINGLLAEWFRLPQFIVSLGTMMIYVGLVSVLSNGQPIMQTAPHIFEVFNSVLPILTWLALLVGSQFLLQFTYVGQYFYAIGDNEGALAAIGVSTRRYKRIACLLCGLFAGVAGVFMMLRTSVATPSYQIDTVFQAIVVLSMSGIFQKGARCNVAGIFLGTVTMTCILVCMTVYAVNPTLQNVVIGLVFFGALLCGSRREDSMQSIK